ncbi:hypothetical protein LINPERPRIM_LOCUS36059, partial [Linum perenne]
RDCDARPHHHHNQFKKPNPVVGGGADEGFDAAPAAAPIETTPAAGKGLKIEDRKESSCSPIRSKREKEEEEEEKLENRMAKLSVSLSRKEIETDFMAMLGRRPARRPRKRPRIVQKQIDALSVGFWLREVNLDTYKVEEEIADTGKVNCSNLIQ